MNHKLVVFDWNGTLLSDTKAAWQAANACLEFYGRPPITLARYRATFHFPVIHFYVRNGCSVDEILARKDESNALFQTTYESLVQNARTRKGAREVLGWLKAKDVHATILSNYLIPRIEDQLSRLGIRDHFIHVCANTDDGTSILQSTTKKERLSAFMVQRGYHPQDTVIIGDSMEEPEIARALGLTSVGITGGTISLAQLLKAEPDHMIGSLTALVPLLAAKWSLPPPPALIEKMS